MSGLNISDSVEFSVNGKQFKVNKDVDAQLKLVDFLRESAVLSGTKWMCREGGCGACIVTMATADPIQPERKEYRAVNSCLIPVLSCHGSEITTVEGIGNKKDGYHPVQSRLAEMNGTQCGFCSPGMVMSAFSLMERKAAHGITMKDVESALDGNICRCTGYRPIMDAFKSFANDAPPKLKSSCIDLEDLGKKCSKTGATCLGTCSHKNSTCSVLSEGTSVFQQGNWYRPESLQELIELMKPLGDQTKYRLVAGNTGTGVYKNDGPYDVYVDVSRILELHQVTKSTPLTIGGGTTLSNLMELLEKIGTENPDYWYAPILAEHIGKIGSTPIRNMGTMAGNLMLKHSHNEFPSDLFVVLETVGSKINLINRNGEKQQLTLSQFLQSDMKGQIIISFTLPPLSKDHAIKTYKIMPRSRNAHAYINAGFCAKLDSANKIVEKPNIIFGGIRPSLIHAVKTEEFLNGKNIGDEKGLQEVMKVLEEDLTASDDWEELNAEEDWLNPDIHYLKSVAQGLTYKFFLSILGDKVATNLKSGAADLQRELSSGKQDFDTDNKEWPISQPTVKVEAKAQCSGEAQYVDDIPLRPDELHGAFVVSTVANCRIDSIDPSEALKADGVVAYLDAKSIQKYENKFVVGNRFGREDEEVFSSGKVLYAGQSLGLILARSHSQATSAAKLVQVKYKDFQTPVLTIKEALKDPSRIRGKAIRDPTSYFSHGNVEAGLKASETIVEGEFEIGNQYHFFMETHVTACVPIEDGMDVYCATQDQDSVQKVIAYCLRLKKSQVNVETRRLGGGFGGKISRSNLVAAACAIAAAELSKPVRIHLDLNTNMVLVGGRFPYYCKYKVGMDEDGRLLSVDLRIIVDCGSTFNEGGSYHVAAFAKNCYSSKAWRISIQKAKTDTHCNTPCRAPGSTECIGIIENLMEHLAKLRKEDPFEFRMKNMDPSNGEVDSLKNIISQLKSSSDYEERQHQVEEFNKNNRWKKRGISLIPMVYPVGYPPWKFNVLVAIYHDDGTVAVSHGGIEMGQGINTKVAQVVAKILGVDLSMVSVKPTSSLANANSSVTGGSMSSELNCYAVLKACEELKERMKPTKDKMPDADWPTLVEACFNSNVDLIARHCYTSKDNVKGYVVHGATVSEVEVDVLTGEKLIRRVDLLEDAGQSISPLVDIGQVEGAFVMGIGLWTSEKITYDPATGKKLTNGTWHYKPPLNTDIPVDFRVSLLRNAAQTSGVLRSKATGEPPLCMAVSVFFALRNAIDAARSDAGNSEWFQMDCPGTIDKLHKMMLVKPEQFKFL